MVAHPASNMERDRKTKNRAEKTGDRFMVVLTGVSIISNIGSVRE
jgi:hypothetical protein